MAVAFARSDPGEVFERFTERARQVVVLAQEEARLLNHSFIGTEHILLGLMHEGEGIAARALDDLGISLEVARQKVKETIGLSGTAPTGSPPFTPRAKKVLELSLREAMQLGHNYIGTEHMLLGLVREGEGVASQVLISLGADLARVRQQVIQLLSGYEGEEPSGVHSAGSSRTVFGGEHRQSQLVECSFCGRLPPESGRLISSRGGAFVCENCLREWIDRLDGDTEDNPDSEAVGVAPMVTVVLSPVDEGAAQTEGDSALDISVSDDPDDMTKATVTMIGVPDRLGIAGHLFQRLTNHSVSVNKIVQNTSPMGITDMSFIVPKEYLSAGLAACHDVRDELLGPDKSS